jgi:1,4-alpha-glucan branching enzyme
MGKAHKKEVGAILHKSGALFRVWAPFANDVAVAGSFNNWSHTPLQAEGDGYWSVDFNGVLAGQEYKFVIHNNGRELYKNDPRSLQVTTSAGNSVIVDRTFDWEDDDFVPPSANKQVIYELHIGTFHRDDPSLPGTFNAAAEKLDYLKDLGINMIELMPIGSMSNDRGWGYSIDYIYAVESLYGGRLAFLEFVKAAHKNGIGVILDVVYNHFGPDGSMDIWQFDGWSQDNKGGIYFYNDWRSNTAWGDTRPDYGRQEVRDYILDNVQMWVQECHLDGIRVDSTVYIRNVYGHNNDPANDLPDGWRLLQDITSLTKKIKPSAIVIGEDVSGNEYITKDTGAGGAGFTAQWEVNFPRMIRDVLDAVDDSNRSLTYVGSALSRYYNADAYQRVIYSDSHDSAANGAARLSEEISPGHPTSSYAQRRSLLASAIVLTAPGIPMLLQGQEFLSGGTFNDWQALDWEQAEKFEGIVKAHSHLISLRKNEYKNSAGLAGLFFSVLHMNEDAKVLAYHRWDKGGPKDDIVVILNFANKTQKDYYINFPRDGKWTIRFNSDWKGYSPEFKNLDIEEIEVENYGGKISIAPYSAIILSQEE